MWEINFLCDKYTLKKAGIFFIIKEALTMKNELSANTNFIMYTTDDGQVEIEVKL
mgnify:CR=1 FL=1